MIWSSLALSLYFARKSVAPENAIWLMYSFTSSAVIPIPLSMTVSVFSSGLLRTMIFHSLSSAISASPIRASFFSFVIASQPFETSSLRKMSWSE